jgi:endonuclease YncB( thermonuclease family)
MVALGTLVLGLVAYRATSYFAPAKPGPLPDIIRGNSPNTAAGQRGLTPKIAAGQKESISARDISVIDGDTIRAYGRIIRLVGFNAPETGERARCAREQELGARATTQMRLLVAGGGLELRLVPCACPPSTEGTAACNFGRSCGELRSYGRDIGTIMIAYRLAHRYVCGAQSCPPPQSWC